MKTLINTSQPTIQTQTRPGLVRRTLGVLALLALLAGLTLARQAQPVLAQAGAANSRTVDITFTKWITSLPADEASLAGVSMAGVVGGAVGDGQYVGTVLSDDVVSKPGFWLGHTRYEFHGDKHTLIADLQIIEDASTDPPTATITGRVISGWLQGAAVTGEYTVLANCPIPTPGNVFDNLCIPGTLHISPHQVLTAPASFTIPAGQCPNLPAGVSITGSGSRTTTVDTNVRADDSSFIGISDVVQGKAAGSNGQAYTFYSASVSVWDTPVAGPVKVKRADLFLLQSNSAQANNGYVLRNGLVWRWTYTPPAGAFDVWPPANFQQSVFFGQPLNSDASAKCDPL